jgi:hypothetical protein
MTVGMSKAEEMIAMIDAYVSATDKMLAEPGLDYREELRFFGVKPKRRSRKDEIIDLDIDNDNELDMFGE